ncbi:MAG: 7TM diverse intracellular signaling domain-containing protein, partial [Novosphingobium sp.]
MNVNRLLLLAEYDFRMRLSHIFWRQIAPLVFAVLASTTARANDVPLRTCIAPQARGQTVTEALAQPAGFICDQKQTRLGRGDFVTELRFAPVRAAVGDQLVLRTASVWQAAARIHYRYADGREWVLDVPAAIATKFVTIGAVLQYPVPPRDVALRSIVIETRDSANLRGVVAGARLMPTSDANRLKMELIALYSAFLGMALALIVYNLSLWTALRNRFQLYYSTMVAALAAYAFSSSGLLALAVPWIVNNDR